jgi:predicted RNA binding protein YcfA (HicA-like mRNA interferase family)
MTKLPRDISADLLIGRLSRLGFAVVRQRGSHMKLHTAERNGQSIWIPRHYPIATGTLHTVLKGVAAHFDMTLADLLH